MSRGGVSVVTVVFAPVLAACSLLLGEGFTDPNADPNVNDGGAATDATNADGSINPGTDGGGENDGSNEGTDGGVDSGGIGACPTAKVSFCDDFERANAADVKGAWQLIDVNPDGALTIEPGGNGNLVLASSITAKGGQAQLSKTFTEQPTKFHLELSLLVKAFSSQNATYVAGIAMPNGAGSPSLVYLYVSPNDLFVVQQVTDGDLNHYWNQALPISLGTKHRIAIDLTFNGKLVVKIDNVMKIDQNAETFLVAKPPSIYLGASSIDSVGDDGSFVFDDFVFTLD